MMTRIVAAVAFALLLGCALLPQTASAYVVAQDVTYWYTVSGESKAGTVVNPSQEWLNDHLSDLLIEVQQTVYDPVQTAEIMQRDGQENGVEGYLYAYSITNLNWSEGLTGFRVHWQVPYLALMTSNRMTPSFWSANAAGSTVPEWLSTPASDAGIAPGETVGGFWAVAATGNDGRLPAEAARVTDGDLVPSSWLEGETSGPLVPGPASMLTLMTGLAGLGVLRALRRR